MTAEVANIRKPSDEDQAAALVGDLNSPMVDAIDKAMAYAIEESVGECIPSSWAERDRLLRLATLVARGAVFRALREERALAAQDQLASPPTHPISQNAFLREVVKFNMIAGRSMDEFNPRAIALHTALQLEELGEKLELGLLAPMDGFCLNTDIFTLMQTVTHMKALGAIMKAGALDGLFEDGDPVELLDGDIDVMIVSTGSMMSQGADIFGAVHAVSGANLKKFPGGVCIKDKDGKIQKPDGWKPADLTPFLHHSKRPASEGLGDKLDATLAEAADTLNAMVPATVTGLDGVERPNPAAGAPKPEGYNPVA